MRIRNRIQMVFTKSSHLSTVRNPTRARMFVSIVNATSPQNVGVWIVLCFMGNSLKVSEVSIFS
jgi:hypothetical protein